MTFQTSSTIFVYEQPDRISPVIHGIAIGELFVVFGMVGQDITAKETWLKIEDGWILCWDGTWYGALIGA